MREIKFRFWDLDRQRMYRKMDGFCDHEAELVGVDINRLFKSIRDSLVPMQYTGLKDETRSPEFPNGKEIYEGDIVKVTNDVKPWISEVSFVGSSFCLVTRSCCKSCAEGKSATCSLDEMWRGIEVIGNMYETPELLGGNDEENDKEKED